MADAALVAFREHQMYRFPFIVSRPRGLWATNSLGERGSWPHREACVGDRDEEEVCRIGAQVSARQEAALAFPGSAEIRAQALCHLPRFNARLSHLLLV